MKKGLIFGICACLLLARPAFAFTGNDWKDWTEELRVIYISGVIDAWAQMVATNNPDKDKPVEAGTWVYAYAVACLKGMPYGQIKAMVTKYLNDKPGLWQQPLPYLIFGTVAKFCPNGPNDPLKEPPSKEKK